MTEMTEGETLKVTQTDYELAESVCSAANIVSHDGYYELNLDKAAETIARHRIEATRPDTFLAPESVERTAILQNKRVNDAIQTALERGELVISDEGWLAALSTPEPVNDTPEGGTLQGPQQLDYAGEKLPVGAPRDPIEEPMNDTPEGDRDAEISDLRMRLITAGCEWQELAEKSAATIARLREAGDALAETSNEMAYATNCAMAEEAIAKWKEVRDATN